jgi:hypothetical protein
LVSKLLEICFPDPDPVFLPIPDPGPQHCTTGGNYISPRLRLNSACIGNAYLRQQHPSLELEEQELVWDGVPEVELGLTNTAAARGAAVSVGSAARPLAVANVELVLKDLDDTKVNCFPSSSELSLRTSSHM